MKALHEFKTEQLYKEYLVTYFVGQFIPTGIIPDRITVDMITQLIDKLPMNRPKVIRSEKEIKDIVARKKDFSISLEPHLKKYGKKMLNDFYAYWTETTQKGDRFRQELEKTWTLERRLNTWSDNNNGITKKSEVPTSNKPAINYGS